MADTIFQTFYPPLKAVDNGDGTYSVAVVMKGIPALSGLTAGDMLVADSAISAVWTPHYYELDGHMKSSIQVPCQVGQYYFEYTGFLGALAFTANRLYAAPLTIGRTMTFDRIGIRVRVLEAGKKGRVGIYADDGAYGPGALVLDAGELSVAGVGAVSVVIDQQLEKGLYWVAIVSDSAVAQITMWREGSHIYDTTGDDPIMGCYAAHAFGALPDPFPAETQYKYGVAVGLRLASLD